MAVFGASLLAILAWLVWDLATYQTEVRVKGERTADSHIEYGKEQIDRLCGSLGPAAFRDCVYERIASAGDHARADQDLEAQQQMAWLTRVLAWIGGLGLVLGIISAFLILRTLWTTQEMSMDQRRIGEAQVRAYLSINVREVVIEVVDNRDGSNLVAKVRIEVANSGSTPAYSPVIYYHIEEAIPERIVPIADPENMQRSPLSNSFISANGVSPDTQLSRVFQVDDPVAFQRFDRLIRFSCCVGFLDEFKAERLTPVISGTFQHWPEGKVSFLPDQVHKPTQG